MMMAALLVLFVVFMAAMLRWLYKWIFAEPTLVNINYPLKDNGVLHLVYYIYYRIYLVLFHRRTNRMNNFTEFGKNAYEMGLVKSEEQKRLEHHKADISHTSMDEIRFMGISLKDGSILDVNIARLPNMNCRLWVYLAIKDDESNVRHYQIPMSDETIFCIRECAEGNVWQVGDLKITCMEPLSKYHIIFHGFMSDKVSGKVDRIKFSFIWRPFTSTMDHLEVATDAILANALSLSNTLPQQEIESVLNQYDQWGTFYGEITINGDEKRDVVFRGSKSRHIGDFDWSNVHKYVDIKIFFEDGTVVNINATSLSTGALPEMVWGYVELGGNITNKITTTDFTLSLLQDQAKFPSLFSIRLNTDGEEYVINLSSSSYWLEKKWGPLKFASTCMKLNGVQAQMTNLSQNLMRKGYGAIRYASSCAITQEEKMDSPLAFSGSKCILTDESRIVIGFEDLYCWNPLLTGGKGSSLAMLFSLSHQNFKIPNGFCVTATAYKLYIESNSEVCAAIADIVKNQGFNLNQGEMKEMCERIRKLFEESSMLSEIENQIKAKISELFGHSFTSKKFAVRSSSTVGEDGEDMSGAGQMETFLGIQGISEICRSVVKCWSSLFDYKAVEYRKNYGQPIDVEMSVIVQEMVDADVAGVMFTRHPVTGDPGTISIAANFGLGESVVAASCEPDAIELTRTYDDRISIKNITIGEKQTKIIMMKDAGGVETVENHEMDKCCLTEEQIVILGKTGLIIEKTSGNPRDIEWAFSHGILYLLQSRPITCIYQMTALDHENEFNTPVMTDDDQIASGNIKEAMPGALLPISSTFGDDMFIRVFRRLGNIFGKPGKFNPLLNRSTLTYKWHRFFNRGEMTYSMNNKYETIEDLHTQHGFDIATNGRVIEDSNVKRMMIERNRYQSKFNWWKKIIASIYNVLNTKRQMKKMKNKYSNFNLNFDDCKSSSEMYQKLLLNTESYMECVYLHLVVSLSSIVLNTSVLMELLKSSTEITNDHYFDFACLMSVEEKSDEVESANVPAALKNLAAEIDKVGGSKTFLDFTKQEALEWLKSGPASVKNAFEAFIERHGHRCISEFDFGAITWGMDPAQLIDPLKANVRNVKAKNFRKIGVNEAMEKLKTNFDENQKKKLKKTVVQAREYVASREQVKSLMIRMVNEYRKVFIKLGKMMVNEGRIADPRLVMFMTHIEIGQLLRTRSSSIIQRAIRRKKLHQSIDKLQFSEISYGHPNVANVADESETFSVIQGTPVSQGIVESFVRVVKVVADAGCIMPGDILVTKSTDIAWSPYFPSLGGVITEIGGLVSHGAVIAREYGIPCVVGVQNAMSKLKSGNIVRLDGSSGKIELLKEIQDVHQSFSKSANGS